MATEDWAATCIQAMVRGIQWRQKQRWAIKAVTKLQALQRGRFTRREYAQLREFSREQENFQQATRRRQLRIWRNEQELYFLQHTNAADLEKIRAFQQRHAARLIQWRWRATSCSTNTSRDGDAIDPCNRIYTYDPFGLSTAGTATRMVPFWQWKHEETASEPSQLSPSLFLSEKEPCTTSSVQKPQAALVDDEAFASRRQLIHERIKRKSAQEKAKAEATRKPRASVVANQRRGLYEHLMAKQAATAKRVLRYAQEVRALRSDKELVTNQLVESCENRVNHLQRESPEQMTPSEEKTQQMRDEVQMMDKWDTARRIRAWNHHRRAVRSALNKRHWWQTQLAGDECDIRRMVVTKSPWEDQSKIWVWPRCENDNQEVNADPAQSHCSNSAWPSMEIQRFLCGSSEVETPQEPMYKAVRDDDASKWWRAHCTQSHLPVNGASLPHSVESSSKISNESDVLPICTSEMVANRDLYELQEQAKRAARTKSIEDDVEQRIRDLAAQVERRVHEMEAQVNANTQLQLEILQHRKDQQTRVSREQQAATTIQRYARGMQGRKNARDVRAEFFVMVRGRAIRRGRCEECGDQRAVLECQQCEESLHFCPICWVQVHSTRRRKAHVAIPMTSVAATTSVERTDPSIVREKATDSSKIKSASSMEEESNPRLRSLLSPSKQSAARSAELPAVEPKKPVVDTKVYNATSYEQRDARSTATAVVSRVITNELVEACALARRAKVEVRETPSNVKALDCVSSREPSSVKATIEEAVQSARSLPTEEASANDKEEVLTVECDGAMMSEVEDAQTIVDMPAEPKQPAILATESEDVILLPDAPTSTGDIVTTMSVEQKPTSEVALGSNASSSTSASLTADNTTNFGDPEVASEVVVPAAGQCTDLIEDRPQLSAQDSDSEANAAETMECVNPKTPAID